MPKMWDGRCGDKEEHCAECALTLQPLQRLTTRGLADSNCTMDEDGVCQQDVLLHHYQMLGKQCFEKLHVEKGKSLIHEGIYESWEDSPNFVCFLCSSRLLAKQGRFLNSEFISLAKNNYIISVC